MSKLTDIVKLAVGGFIVLGAVLSSSLIASNVEKKSGGKAAQQSSQTSEPDDKPQKVSPITEAMKAAAEACDYAFDPSSVVMEQKEEGYKFSSSASGDGYYDSNLSGLSYTDTRAGHNLVYVFEGEYSEGYQGQYNTYLTGMYLWDDGLFAGKSNSTNFKGYWYNSSITAPEDDPATENVNEAIDTLVMVSDTSKLDYIKAEPPLGGSGDFYELQAYVYMHPGWGDGRSVVVSGYKYYPNVAAFIDTNGYDEMAVGDKFVINSTWFFDRVIKNLSYTPIIPTSEIKWTLPSGMIDDKKKLTAPGEYEIKAEWKEYSATATLKVTA